MIFNEVWYNPGRFFQRYCTPVRYLHSLVEVHVWARLGQQGKNGWPDKDLTRRSTKNLTHSLKNLIWNGSSAEEICSGQMTDSRTERPKDGWLDRCTCINVGLPQSRTLIFFNFFLFQISHFSVCMLIVYVSRQYLSARRGIWYPKFQNKKYCLYMYLIPYNTVTPCQRCLWIELEHISARF